MFSLLFIITLFIILHKSYSERYLTPEHLVIKENNSCEKTKPKFKCAEHDFTVVIYVNEVYAKYTNNFCRFVLLCETESIWNQQTEIHLSDSTNKR